MYGQIIFHKGTKNMQWRKESPCSLKIVISVAMWVCLYIVKSFCAVVISEWKSYYYILHLFSKIHDYLDVVAQWIECQTANWRAAGLIPSFKQMPGLWARSRARGAWQATTCWCVFPSLSPSPPLSKNKYKNV